MSLKPALYGFAFGVFAPVAGLFIGLQVSPLLANILMFPIIAVSALTGTPLGEMSGLMIALMIGLSGVVWALVFWGVSALHAKTNSQVGE